jgi:uncharacterized protein
VTAYFFDSSVLVKRYVSEAGTEWVRAATNRSAQNIIFIAQIASVEVASALARRKRDGSVPARTADAARIYLNRHSIREYEIVYLSDAITQRAQDLTNQYVIRALDAIQLASALEIQSKIAIAHQPSLVFVSGDTRLLTVAASEKLPIQNPI